MCSTFEQIHQACGFLILNKYSVFTYCCKACACIFELGSDLESHILQEHSDDEYGLSTFDNDSVVMEHEQDHGEFMENRETKACKYKSLEQKTRLTSRRTSKISKYDLNPSIEDQKADSSRLESENEKQLSENVHSSKEHIDENGSVNTLEEPSALLTKDKCFIKSISEIVVNTLTENQLKQNVRKKPRNDSSTPAFHCDMCPKNKVSFSSKGSVRQHMKRHIKNKVRKQCPVCLKIPLNYDKHMKFTHMESNPYKCDFCEATFKNNSNRVIHMRSHTGERPYLCFTCGKSFKSQDTRNKHNMRVHIKKLPHDCNQCKRSFISPSQLQEHCYAFHSDARPYTCEICGNSYSTKKYLRKHKYSHGEKTHSCNYCEKKFKTTETRRWHERTVHKVV